MKLCLRDRYFPGFHRAHRRFDGIDDFQGKTGGGFLRQEMCIRDSLAVVIRSVQIGDQAGFSIIGECILSQLVPCEFNIMGKQQGHEAVLAEVGLSLIHI